MKTSSWPRLLLPLTLTLAGCAWDRRTSTLVPRSDLARSILEVYGIVTVAAAVIAAVVFGLLAIILVRFRGRPGAPLPSQVHGHRGLEITWTIIPALILLVIAIPTIRIIFRTQAAPAAGDLAVTVVAHQWWWEFRYPSLQVVTANELHLPVDRTVLLRLESADVIHSFWIPELGGKRDVIPGHHNEIVLTPNTPGEYWGQCAEFCGTSHANMRMKAFVETPEAFERWVAAQRSAAATPTGAAGEGKNIYTQSACMACHTIQGVSVGIVGPDLTHVGSRTTIAAGMLDNTAENVAAWIKDAPALKPGSKMPNLGVTDAQARALTAYLESLK